MHTNVGTPIDIFLTSSVPLAQEERCYLPLQFGLLNVYLRNTNASETKLCVQAVSNHSTIRQKENVIVSQTPGNLLRNELLMYKPSQTEFWKLQFCIEYFPFIWSYI